MMRQPDIGWFITPPGKTIEGYTTVIERPMCLQDVARKLFRGCFRKTKRPRLGGKGEGGDDAVPPTAAAAATTTCPFCEQADFRDDFHRDPQSLEKHLRAEHYYADEFNEKANRCGRFFDDMILIMANCRQFNNRQKKFVQIADKVRCRC
jgi:hypothetical protein